MRDSNFSMAHNYSIDQLPTYLASNDWFWSERPVNLQGVGFCSNRHRIIPFLPNVALLPSEHTLLGLGWGSGQYKMTSLMDRAEFNPRKCLKWDDSWPWMWPCTGVNEDTYSYWELAGLYFWDPKLPMANWASSARLRCPGAWQFPVLTEKVFLVVTKEKLQRFLLTAVASWAGSPGVTKVPFSSPSLYRQALIGEKANFQA